MRVHFDYQMSIPCTLFQFSKYVMTCRWCDFQKTLIVGQFPCIITSILLYWTDRTTRIVIWIVPQWLMDGLIKSENFPLWKFQCRVSKIRLLGQNKEQMCIKPNVNQYFPNGFSSTPQTVNRFRDGISLLVWFIEIYVLSISKDLMEM